MTLFRRKKKFVINEPDPTYNCIYLGNVVTIMAKGDACYEKPLALIWKTYQSRTRPDLPMRLMVTRCGLKAYTKQQGLTEYWAHRITYCVAPPNYPKVFVWIYKHEGKKMKPELRCHAVLLKKVEQPPAIAVLLHEKLSAALRDYKREKISKQNVRLAGLNPTLPMRKQMLSSGQNFRPPMNRSKSAPRLHSIEECPSEEEMEEEEEEEEEVVEEDSESTSSEVFTLPPDTPSEDRRENEFFAADASNIDLEIGNDIDQLKLDARVHKCLLLRNHSQTSEPGEIDSVSDESGYHEKSSLEGEDSDSERQQRNAAAAQASSISTTNSNCKRIIAALSSAGQKEEVTCL